MSPTPADDSYGTPEGVAAWAPLTVHKSGEYIDADIYTENDVINPSLSTVVNWIDKVSAMLNAALANHGFKTPLTVAKSVRMAADVVEEIVAARALFVNNKGRFFVDKAKGEIPSIIGVIAKELDDWVLMYAAGLEEDGNPRPGSELKIGVRSHDENGNEMFPIFQRDAFGNRFENWNKKR